MKPHVFIEPKQENHALYRGNYIKAMIFYVTTKAMQMEIEEGEHAEE